MGEEGREGHRSPPAQAPEEEGGCWRKPQVQKHAEESSLPRAGGAGRPRPLGGPVRTLGCSESTGVASVFTITSLTWALGEGLTSR